MTLSNVKVPLYDYNGEVKNKQLIINEFAGKITLAILEGEKEIEISCYWDDLERAWNAVKR